ncbi:MAG: hypothetical protein ISQ99_07330 [Flavobacteriales bacterium]|nr:hypothetical protein [Flavobacteriales bacterium]
MYAIKAAYITKRITAFAIPIVSPDIKIKNVKTVRIKSTINTFKLNDRVTGSITIGP